jgi:hypothetical protein
MKSHSLTSQMIGQSMRLVDIFRVHKSTVWISGQSKWLLAIEDGLPQIYIRDLRFRSGWRAKLNSCDTVHQKLHRQRSQPPYGGFDARCHVHVVTDTAKESNTGQGDPVLNRFHFPDHRPRHFLHLHPLGVSDGRGGVALGGGVHPVCQERFEDS